MKISRRVWLPSILLAAFVLRLYRLGVASLWYDETVSVYLAQRDLVEITRHTAGDIHPPLYYYLLHFWGQLAGWSEFSVAFLSLFFGLVLVALVYRVACEWLNRRVALIAAFLVAISPYNVWYSQEVRMYTLGATLGLASMYLFLRILNRQSSVASQSPLFSRDFVAYAVLSALGLYALYYFAFLLVFENIVALVWLFLKSKPRFSFYALHTWFSSQFAILVLYVPWAPIAFRQATDPPVPPWRSFTVLPQVLIESFSALTFGQSIDPLIALPMLVLVGIVVLFALSQRGRWSMVGGQFLLGYTAIPLAIIYTLSLWKPLYHVRYVFLYAPAFYILLALGLSRIKRYALRFTFYILLMAVCAFSLYNFWFEPKYADDDLRGAVNYIEEHWRPGDAILINAGYTYTAFDYYFHQPIAWRGRLTDYAPSNKTEGAVVLQTGSIGGAPNLGWGNPRSDFYATTGDATRSALDRVFAAHPRLWMLRLYDTVVDPDGVVRDYLATRGRIIDDQGFAGESYARAQGYLTSRGSLNPPPSETIVRRNITLGNRIILVGFDGLSHAGQFINVNLYWQTIEPTNIDNRLFMGLYAQDGTLVASYEETPLGNAFGTSRWTPGEILREPLRLPIPSNIPPGIYNLGMTLYNPLTGESLSATPSEWITENGRINLTEIRIDK